MDDRKIKILEDIMAYLSDSQGSELHDEMMKSKAPAIEIEAKSEGEPMIMEEKEKSIPGMDDPKEDAAEMGMGEEEMTDDELQELLREHLKG